MRVWQEDEVFEVHVENHEFEIKRPNRPDVGWFSIEISDWSDPNGYIDGKIFIDQSKIDEKLKLLIRKGYLVVGVLRFYEHDVFSYTSNREPGSSQRKKYRVERYNYFRLAEDVYEEADFHINIPYLTDTNSVAERTNYHQQKVELCLAINGYCSNTDQVRLLTKTGKKHIYEYVGRPGEWRLK